MRVLHVAESIKGGCGTYLDQIIPEQRRDLEIAAIRVIVPDAHVAQVGSVPEELIRTFVRSDRSSAGLRSLARVIRRELAEFQPDVIHLHSTFAGGVGRVLARLAGSRPAVVYCAHGWAFDMERAGWKLKAVALAERLMAPLADRIVAISDYERQRGIDVGIAPARITTVWNGLADAESAPAPARADDRLNLLFIGRLDRQKGFDLLLDAVADLGDRVRLRAVGASVVGDEQALDTLPGHVELLGWRTPAEIRTELAAADLVVVPSRWEGFGLVAIEAMRAGKPVVAAKVGGLPEVVADGETGLLVAPGDVAALRAAILAPDAARLAAMGAAGRQRFLAHFTIDRTVAGLKTVYRDVLAKRQGRSPEIRPRPSRT